MELNKIYNESNLDTMAKMPNDFIDLTVTSPPYNIGSLGFTKCDMKPNYDTHNDEMSKEEYSKFIINNIKEILRVTKYHVAYNIQETVSNFGIITEIRKKFDGYIKEIFVWVKSNPQPTINPHQITSSFEYIIFFSKDTAELKRFTYCNFNSKGKNIIRNSFYKPVNSGKGNGGQGYAFPEWLPSFFIHNFSKPKDLIYDPFMGSGTTGKMAVKLNRNYIGSEISKEYCSIANKRIKNELDQYKLF